MNQPSMLPSFRSGSRPAEARINLLHLRYNYALLKQRSAPAEIMAVVKANAYGHGINKVALTLFNAGCQSFAVTDASEGVLLRQAIPAETHTEIVLLSGLFNLQDAEHSANAALTPVITEQQHIDWLQTHAFHGGIWIKIDSGMNRLGASDPAQLFARCERAGINVCGFMSHLSCADEPAHPMNQQQIKTFTQICEQIAPDLPRSILNSAGITAMPEQAMQVVRPGIALYGIESITEMSMGLKPVMTFTGAIMQLRTIAAGETVSYGASFLASQPMRIATVSLGYADGVPRGLSDTGHVVINDKLCPIIGRVCMDYTMVAIEGTDATIGDHVEFWGETILANDVAAQLDTISYTLFTGIGNRVQRIEVSE